MIKNPAQEIIEAVQILIDNSMKKTTNINSGIITAINEDGRYVIYIKGVKHILPSYPKCQTLDVGDNVLVITPQGQNNQAFIIPNSIDNFVKKTGDNMTWNLNIVDNKINSLVIPSENTYGKSININDTNGINIGKIQTVLLATGESGIEISTTKEINGVKHINSIGLFIDINGNKSIKISNPNAWREALNIS